MPVKVDIQRESLQDYKKYDELRISAIHNDHLQIILNGVELTVIELALLKACNSDNKWLKEKAKEVLKKIYRP
jgi:hypothetical protein